MKRMLEFVKKLNTPLTYGIICAVFGLAFIVLPLIEPLILDVLIAVAGVVAILIGILMIPELNTPDRALSYYLSVGKTLAFIGVGIFLITARSALATHFCFAFGVYILLRAIPVLIKSILLPSLGSVGWWVRIVLSILEITLGAWLIFFPRWPHLLAGAMLLLVAIDLFLKLYKNRPTTLSDDGTIYDLDFEDKS